ncbi:MAG: RNA-binding protein [Spirosomaceae bacterium]|jgi:RNA recognition motif-containing protein|nr:RNA-binding protein [Spirosomataceae bacterium]
MDIYVGSIPFKWKEERLREIFEEYGEVESATIIIDKVTRQNKGFGFVVMTYEEEGRKAVKALNGAEIDGRTIVVNISVPKKREEKKEVKPRFSQEKPDKKGWKPFKGNNKGKRF